METLPKSSAAVVFMLFFRKVSACFRYYVYTASVITRKQTDVSFKNLKINRPEGDRLPRSIWPATTKPKKLCALAVPGAEK
jgi:hypothetical protein